MQKFILLIYCWLPVFVSANGQMTVTGADAVAAASAYSAREAQEKNYGDQLIVSRGNAIYRAFLRFDLKSLPDREIKDAVIILYSSRQYHKSPAKLDLHALSEEWEPAACSWKNRKTGTPWANSGGTFAAEVLASCELDGDSAGIRVAFQGEALTRMLEEQRKHPERNFGFVIMTAGKYKGQTMKFFAGPKVQDGAYCPQLAVSFDAPLSPAQFGVLTESEKQKARFLRRGEVIAAQTKLPEAEVAGFKRELAALNYENPANWKRAEEQLLAFRLAAAKVNYPAAAFALEPDRPWEQISPDFVPSPQTAATARAPRGGFGNLSFTLTNLTEQSQGFRASTGNAAVTLRLSAWVKALLNDRARKPGQDNAAFIDDALIRLEENDEFVLAPGETRRLHLVVDTGKLQPGKHQIELAVTGGSEMSRQTAVLEISKNELVTPTGFRISSYAYLNRLSTANFPEAAVRDLFEHRENAFVLNLVPQIKAGGAVDFAAIRAYLKTIKGAREVIFFWNCEGGKLPFCPPADWGKPEGVAKLAPVIKEWYRVCEEAGFAKSQVLMYPFDETYDNPLAGKTEYDALLAVAGMLKEIDPEIRIFANPVSFRKTDLPYFRELAPYIDVWAPVRALFEPGVTIWPHRFDETDKAACRQFFEEERQKGKPLWTYCCDGPMKLLDLTSYYRRYPYLVFAHRIAGYAIWSYNDVRGASSWSDEDGGDFSMIYELRDAPPELNASASEPLIPSRRRELWREGVQNFLLLQNLAERHGRAKVEALIQPLLAPNAAAADFDRVEAQLFNLFD